MAVAHLSCRNGTQGEMITSRNIDSLVVSMVLGVVYFIAGMFGLLLACAHHSSYAVWPATGIALAALLIFGYRVWPAIFVGALLVNVTIVGSLATSVGIGIGNTLEGLLGAYLVNRFARGCDTLDYPESLFWFIVLAGVISTTVSATCGVLSLFSGGFARWVDLGSIWLTWWLGDMAGNLVVAPVLLTWNVRRRPVGEHGKAFEVILSLGGLLLVSQLIFGGLFPSNIQGYPLEFLCMPFLLWAALRFR